MYIIIVKFLGQFLYPCLALHDCNLLIDNMLHRDQRIGMFQYCIPQHNNHE